jgi:hypothetical protein
LCCWLKKPLETPRGDRIPWIPHWKGPFSTVNLPVSACFWEHYLLIDQWLPVIIIRVEWPR